MTDPVAAYSFDEASGAVLDRTGNGHDWTLNNGAIRDAGGHTNGGLTKNAVGMPVVASTSFIGSTAWTFMFWRRRASTGGAAVWWLRLNNTSEGTGSGLLDLGSGLQLRVRKSGSPNATTAVTVPAGTGWHHYAATYNGTNGRLYIDGVLVATSASVTAPLTTVNVIDMMEFTTANEFWDDLRFWTSALDVTEINTWMNTPVTDAPSGITGELDATLPLPTLDIAGDLTVAGDLDSSLPLPVLDLAGSVTVSGSFSATLPLPTAAMSGSLRVSGSLDTSLPLVALDAAGTTRIRGLLAGALPLPELEAAGSVTVAGELAAVLPLPTLALAGSLEGAIAGVFTGTLPLPELDLAGTVTESITGVLAGELPVPQLSLVGTSAGIPPDIPAQSTLASIGDPLTLTAIRDPLALNAVEA